MTHDMASEESEGRRNISNVNDKYTANKGMTMITNWLDGHMKIMIINHDIRQHQLNNLIRAVVFFSLLLTKLFTYTLRI